MTARTAEWITQSWFGLAGATSYVLLNDEPNLVRPLSKGLRGR